MARGNGMSMCVECGHARMAHLNGGCSYCGCRGTSFQVETGIYAPGAGRRASGIARSTPSDPGLTSPQRALLDFVGEHLDEDEARRFGAGVARANGLSFAPGRPFLGARRIVASLKPEVARRYLVELERRHRSGEPLVREIDR